MKKLIAILLTTLLTFFSLVPIQAKESYLKSLNIDCSIDENSTATFTETWDLYAYKGTEMYKDYSNLEDTPLTLISVKDENGNKYEIEEDWDINRSIEEKAKKCGVIENGDDYEICVGIGSLGHHVFTVTYKIKHFVNKYSDLYGINYAFLSDMALPIRSSKIRLTVRNQSLSQDNSRIWGFGYEGQCIFEDGSVVLKSESEIDGNKIQLLMSFDKLTFKSANTVHEKETFEEVLDDALEGADFGNDSDEDDEEYYDDEDSIFPPFAFFGVFFIIWAFVTMLLKGLISTGSRVHFVDGQTVDRDVHMFRDIPCNKDLLYFYYLAYHFSGISKEKVKSGILAAYLLKWINSDSIRYIVGEKKGLIFKHDTYEIRFRQNIECDSQSEADLLEFFKEASGDDHILQTREFERWCGNHQERMHKWFKAILEEAEDNLKNQGLATLTVKEGFLGHKTDVELKLRVKEEAQRVIGFYKFLKDQDNMKEKSVIEVKLWDEYLIFASVLGLAEEVTQQLRVACPDYEDYVRNTHGYSYTDYMTVCHVTNAFTHSAYERSIADSSSSGGGGSASFGGGGGGFSGGGGGGLR